MLIEEALGYLEGVNGKQIRLGLENMTLFMKKLKWPDEKLKIIHITGTNGKGSTSEALRYMLEAAGYKIGSFNSPYFDSPCECIRINGTPIKESELLSLMNEVETILSDLKQQEACPSGFEILVGIALQYFKRCQVDFVILEVGLGGKLDATNVIRSSMLSVFTRIALDHTNFLGNTIELVAREKAGIIKNQGLVVTAYQEREAMKVLEAVCSRHQAKLIKLTSEEVTDIQVTPDGTTFNLDHTAYRLKMIGGHQAYNCSLAIKCLLTLKEAGMINVTNEQLKEGAYQFVWPGRFEKIKDLPYEVYLDGAHNLDGVKALKETLQALPKVCTIGVVGVLKDKAFGPMLALLKDQLSELIITEPDHMRALSKEALYEEAKQYYQHVIKADSISKAIALADTKAVNSKEPVRVIYFGSLYLIAEIRRKI